MIAYLEARNRRLLQLAEHLGHIVREANVPLELEPFKQFVVDQSTDMVGIAPGSRFDDVLRGHHATSFVPASKSLIVFGIALNEYIVNWHDLLARSEPISSENQPLVAGPHSLRKRCLLHQRHPRSRRYKAVK